MLQAIAVRSRNSRKTFLAPVAGYPRPRWQQRRCAHFEWIRNKREKIREDDWREFEKGLHLYLKDKDTSVFSDDELYDIYESILSMSQYWRIAFAQFSKDFPNSAKIKSKGRRSKKYQATCFQLKRELRKSLDDEIFEKAFESAMA